MGLSCKSLLHTIHPMLIPNLHESKFHFLISMSFPQNPRYRFHFPPNNAFKLHRRNVRIRHNSPTNPSFRIRASTEKSQVSSNTRLIIVTSAITVMLAVANRVLYKLALVPMKQYPFFLAQFTTFGYVAIYSSMLYVRYRAGIVTDEMLALPKSRFMVIGILEALGVAAGMSAAAMLPGPAIPILNQTFLVWQLSFSALLLGRRYSFNQIAGCLLVAAGIVVAIASASNGAEQQKSLLTESAIHSWFYHVLLQEVLGYCLWLPVEKHGEICCGSNSNQMLSRIGFVWPALMIASSAVQAVASILKEFVFVDAATRLKGKSLDIFVVNSFGSGFQALFVLLFLPFLSNLKGVPFAQLSSYLKSGVGCLLNIGANIPGCDGAPLLPLLYIITNLSFNISLLNLVKISSAVVASLAAMLSVPISIYILSLPLPYLPEGASLSPFFLLGSAILVLGLILYNIPQRAKQDSKIS